MQLQTSTSPIGHNSSEVSIAVEVRLFNSLVRHAGSNGPVGTLALPAGSTVGDVVRLLAIPINEIFLVMRNGRDVSPSLYGGINTHASLEDGDVLALSGPVPYSWGYGAPIV